MFAIPSTLFAAAGYINEFQSKHIFTLNIKSIVNFLL